MKFPELREILNRVIQNDLVLYKFQEWGKLTIIFREAYINSRDIKESKKLIMKA